MLAILLLPFLSFSQEPWINEIHYDNDGGDINEGIEIAGPAGTNLACYELIPYNGSGGASYSITTLSGIIPDEGCGYGAVWFPILNLQNGAPDGIALHNTCTNTLISFLSYEGTFVASTGPATGIGSTDVVVTETGTTPIGQSLQLTGSGNVSSNFTWTGPSAGSPGLLNTGQTISPCGAPNTITTGTVSGGPFNVDCTNSMSDAGTVSFTSSGTFNPSNVYNVELSDETGSFTSPTVIGTLASTANAGIINFTLPSTLPTGIGYLIRIVSDDPAVTGTTSIAFTITQLAPCGVNSITSGTVSGGPFTVDCTNSVSDGGTIDFTSTGVFTAGNSYSVELSDATGSFASPTVIGSLASTANSGTINFTLPATLATGTGYLMRVVSDNPVVTGSTTAPISIVQLAPCITPTPVSTGVIINEWSNGPSGNQEFYEFVVAGQCGTLVDVRGYILDDNNGTFTAPASYPGTSSGIADGHFRFSNAAQWASIPVGSLIVVYNNDDPNPALPADDPTDANNDSLYVVPHDNALFERCTTLPAPTSPDSTYSPCTYATAPLTGWGPLSLRNSGDAIQVRNPDGTYYHGVSYGGSEMTGGPNNLKLFNGSGSGMMGWFNDGDFFDVGQWSSGPVSAGTETPGLPNNATNAAWLVLIRNPNAATCPLVILPVELMNFAGKRLNEDNFLHWQTQTEINSSLFTLERSTDLKKWDVISIQPGAGNSQNVISYSFVDRGYTEGVVNYYRLSQTDFDGQTETFSKIVSINNTTKQVSRVRIVNLLGQDINENTRGVQIHVFSDGSSQKVFKP